MAAAAAIIVPLVITPSGKEAFRLPKELVLRAAAIAVAALAVILFAAGKRPVPPFRRDPVLLVCLAVAGWTALAAATSSNLLLSAGSLAWVLALLALFLAAYAGAAERSLGAAALLLPPAAANSILAVLQTFDLWQPFTFRGQQETEAMRTALVGNPRDLGAYLVVPALVAVALTVSSRGAMRVLSAASVLAISAALVFAGGLTALAAFAAGCGTMMLIGGRRSRTAAAGAVLVLSMILYGYAPIRERIVTTVSLARAGEFDEALSRRLTAFLAAWYMALDHPITGVGPGCYGWAYFDYKLAVERRHPEQLASTARHLNFGEAHNDHLQTMAVAGFPGYLLFLGAAGTLASVTFRRGRAGPEGPRRQFARLTALPVTVSFLIVASAFFPLELAVTAMTYAMTAAICLAWRHAA